MRPHNVIPVNPDHRITITYLPELTTFAILVENKESEEEAYSFGYHEKTCQSPKTAALKVAPFAKDGNDPTKPSYWDWRRKIETDLDDHRRKASKMEETSV